MILADFEVLFDVDALMGGLRLDESFREEFEAVCVEVRALARPKAKFTEAVVTQRDEGGVTIDGRRIDSRVAAENIAGGSRVMPYVVTCGMEMHEYFLKQDDPLVKYWCDYLNMSALRQAIDATREHAERILGKEKLFAVNPGSTVDWPLTGQRLLFDLVGDVSDSIGVKLEESCLMTPTKSVSGVFFSGDKEYCNCMLCPRENCPNRKAKRMEDPCFK